MIIIIYLMDKKIQLPKVAKTITSPTMYCPYTTNGNYMGFDLQNGTYVEIEKIKK